MSWLDELATLAWLIAGALWALVAWVLDLEGAAAEVQHRPGTPH